MFFSFVKPLRPIDAGPVLTALRERRAARRGFDAEPPSATGIAPDFTGAAPDLAGAEPDFTGAEPDFAGAEPALTPELAFFVAAGTADGTGAALVTSA